MKNKKVLLLLMAVLLFGCGNSYDVWDRQLTNHEPSHNINTRNRYCLYFQEFNAEMNTKNYNITQLNKQVTASMKELGINMHAEDLPSFTGGGGEMLKNKIIKREQANGFRNCEYLIEYGLTTSRRFPNNAYFSLQIFDIKTKREIGFYQISGDNYNKSKQNQYIATSIQKWWEFQNSDKKRKFIMYNCADGKCVTRECNMYTCVVK